MTIEAVITEGLARVGWQPEHFGLDRTAVRVAIEPMEKAFANDTFASGVYARLVEATTSGYEPETWLGRWHAELAGNDIAAKDRHILADLLSDVLRLGSRLLVFDLPGRFFLQASRGGPLVRFLQVDSSESCQGGKQHRFDFDPPQPERCNTQFHVPNTEELANGFAHGVDAGARLLGRIRAGEPLTRELAEEFGFPALTAQSVWSQLFYWVVDPLEARADGRIDICLNGCGHLTLELDGEISRFVSSRS